MVVRLHERERERERAMGHVYAYVESDINFICLEGKHGCRVGQG